MNIKVARAMDYWLGIPICFILSIFHSLQKFITKVTEPTNIKPQKIMFLKFSEIGSAILTYPVVKSIRDKYPAAKFYFWVFRENKEAVHTLNIIPPENIITLRSKNILLMLLDLLKNIWQVWREKIDIAIDMELFSRFSSIISYLSGAKLRVGFHKYTLEGLYRGNFYTHRVVYNPYIHISTNFYALADSLNTTVDDVPLVKKPAPREREFCLPKFNFGVEDRELILNKLRLLDSLINLKSKIIVVNIGFSDKIPIRRWPLKYYLELINRLLERRDLFVVLVGIGSVSEAAIFCKYNRCINLIGKTTVKELLSLFTISQAIISHDSGIIHLASLTNIYIIALFGPETPLLYGPLTKNKKIFYKNFMCSPCLSAYNHRSSVCKNNKCMQAIMVDEVYSEIVNHV